MNYYYIGKRTKAETAIKTIEKIQRYKNDKVIFIFDMNNFETSFIPYFNEAEYRVDYNGTRLNEPIAFNASKEDEFFNCSIMITEDNAPSLFNNFPYNLLSASNNDIFRPMYFILETTYELAQGKKNADISGTIANLFAKGIYVEFPKFPWLNTENIAHIIELATGSKDINQTTIEEVFRYQLSLLQTLVDYQHDEKSLSIKSSGKNYGYQTSAVRTAKEEEVKNKMVEYLSNPDYRNQYSDRELINMIGTSRMTFYKYKKQLEEEGKI